MSAQIDFLKRKKIRAQIDFLKVFRKRKKLMHRWVFVEASLKC
jgi:hypothetical protein